MNEVIEAGSSAPMTLTPPRVTPADLVALAVQQQANPETLRQLMELQIRWDQHQLVLAKVDAEKAFNVAMAAFKANPLEILKDQHVSYVGQKGQVDYHHASHYGMTTVIAASLSQHGLSHSWTTAQIDGQMTVTCTIKHVAGHSIWTSMTAGYDSSGGKNAIQAIASAKTYLERHTLQGLTGCSTKNMPDDDGRGAGGAPATPQTVENVLQGMLADLMKFSDDETCVALWNTGKKTLAALGDRTAYDEFKAAVAGRRNVLKGQQ